MMGLVACGNNKNDIYTTSFKARIIESNGDTVIVEPLENEDIRRSADKISVGIGNVKKYVPEVLPVGTLVEIVYDGNINETYPAQINVLGFRTIMEESEIPTVVAYVNWSPNESSLIRECLNSETMTISSVRHLPIFKFETKTELDEFKNKYKGDFTMDQGYDGNPSFNEVTVNYNDDFFKDNTLILAYISAGSGSFRYGVSEVTKENGTLMMTVTQLNNLEVYTDDMSGWFLMAEVTKEYLKDCTKFDAQFVKDILDSRLENVIISEDTIIIPNGKNENESQHIYRITKFVENAQNGIEDEIKIIQYTIEGDPIIKDVRYNSSNGTFEIITDTTQDKFGVQDVYNNVYDSSYEAKAGEIQINGEAYYDFKLINGENEVNICRFIKHS